MFFLNTSDHTAFVGLLSKTEDFTPVFLSPPQIFELLGVSHKQKSHLNWLLLKCQCVAFEKNIFIIYDHNCWNFQLLFHSVESIQFLNLSVFVKVIGTLHNSLHFFFI